MKMWIGCLLCVSVLARAQFPEPVTPPNIVIILADDLGYNDVGAYTHGDGTSLASYTNSSYHPLPGPNKAATLTPRIDSLATDGLKFTNYYASAAQCSPARAALLTGTYPYRNGIPNVLIPNSNDPSRARGLHENERTLPELLKERGYATAAVGKWHLGDTLQFLPTRHGFDSWFGIPYSNDMWPFNTGRGSWPKLYLYENDGTTDYTTATGGQILGEITTDAEQSYLLEAMTEKALAFIDAEKDRPFFLYFSPHAVHVPCFPHPDFRGDTVSWYYDQVKELDHRVGQIIDRLETHGLTDNTIVIFSSDNGPWLNRNRPSDAEQAVGSAYPLWGRKSSVWEGGPRVPFLVKWPAEIPAGEVRDQIAQHIDLLPTLVKLAGGEVPVEPVIDGGDLWPVWKEDGASPSDEFYYFMSTTLYAVRKGDWKYYSTSGSGADAGTLVNLDTDIQEQSDVSGANGAKVSELSGLRTTFWNEINANNRPAGIHSSQGIVVETATVPVNEGGSGSLRIRLIENPVTTRAVTVARVSGDTDVTVSGSGQVTFTPSNWNSWQTVTLLGAEDGDTLHGSATLHITGSWLPLREVYAREVDNDTVPEVGAIFVWPRDGHAMLPDEAHGLIVQGAALINTVENPEGSTYQWSQVSGAPVIFEKAADAESGVRFPSPGTYVLRLTTGYPNVTSSSQDVEVTVGGVAGGEVERALSDLDPPGVGLFGPTGVSNYYALNDSAWHEESNAANNNGANTTANLREVLQDESNDTVPLTAQGTHWLNLAPDATYTTPAVYQSLGLWNTGDGTSFRIRFDVGERSNVTFGAVKIQVIKTDSGFTGNDGTLLSSAPGVQLLAETATIQEGSAGWTTVSGGRVMTGREETVTLVGISDGDKLWIRIQATGSGTQSLVDGVTVHALPENVSPVIDPIADVTVGYAVGDPQLTAVVTDDGIPSGIVNTQWQVVSTPVYAGVTVSDAGQLTSSFSLSVPGNYTIRLIADDTWVKVYRDVTITRLHQTLAEWAGAEGLPVDQRGPDGNSDGDPFVNLVEFALGLDPHAAEGLASGKANLVSAGGLKLEVDVPRDRNPSIRLTSRSELSGEEAWEDTGVLPTKTIVDATRTRWSFSISEPVLNKERIFYRLEMLP
jgi:arylsulfatase